MGLSPDSERILPSLDITTDTDSVQEGRKPGDSARIVRLPLPGSRSEDFPGVSAKLRQGFGHSPEENKNWLRLEGPLAGQDGVLRINRLPAVCAITADDD